MLGIEQSKNGIFEACFPFFLKSEEQNFIKYYNPWELREEIHGKMNENHPFNVKREKGHST